MERGVSDVPKHTPPLDERNNFSYHWMRWFGALRDSSSKQATYEVSFNPASVPANSISKQAVTVTGLTTNDIITVNPPALTTGLALIEARVSAADTATFTYLNSTGAAIDQGAGTYLIHSVRK